MALGLAGLSPPVSTTFVDTMWRLDTIQVVTKLGLAERIAKEGTPIKADAN